MKKYKWILILVNLLLLLVYINFSIARKEELIVEGQLVLLELAPVDPRSLMQGDYMQLRYQIANDIDGQAIPRRGYCVVRLNSKGIAEKIRFQESKTPLSDGEYLIRYWSPSEWNVNIGAESYFFQEGDAEKYVNAKYGGVRIDEHGNSLLIGLYDEQQKYIE